MSNNNGVEHDFAKVFAAGHRRVYLKASEGSGFSDRTFAILYTKAKAAGFKVGAYHFAHGPTNAGGEAVRFLGVIRGHHLDLAPCLDLEHGRPELELRYFAERWFEIIEKTLDTRGLLYSFASFIEGCRFTRANANDWPLWLASFGIDDGKEHPLPARLPKPWTVANLAAHQYTQHGRVDGIRGNVDLSRVLIPSLVDRRAK